MNTEFGKLLRQYRELNGLSQSELKDRLDTQGYPVTESAISKWENGIHVPKAEVVEVLEDILMPKSVGFLLRAAGYRAEAEIRFQSSGMVREEESPQSKELQTTALIIVSNLEKIRNAPPQSLGDLFGNTVYRVEERVYGGWWVHEDRARLGDVDRAVAAKLLKRLQEEGGFPELADIDDWKELKEDSVTEDFIQRLNSRAHRGNL